MNSLGQHLLGGAASLLLATSLSGQTFTVTSVGLPTTHEWGTSIVDYNADGLMDLLCFDAGQPAPQLFRQAANGSFAKVDFPLIGKVSRPARAFWGDENGDGLMDVIVPGTDDLTSEPLIAAIRQTPEGIFEAHHLLSLELLGWWDLDNDGKGDLLVFDPVTFNPVIYWKQADGSYGTPTPFPRLNPPEVHAMDFDSDGDLDLAFPASEGFTIYRNDGHRVLTPTGISLASDLFTDVDGDGLIDVVFNRASRDTGRTSKGIQFNRGALRFQEQPLDTGSLIFSVADVADFNADGRPDFFLVSWPLGIGFPPRLSYQQPGGSFREEIIVFPAVMELYEGYVADFDGDYDLDLLGIGPNAAGQRVRLVFRNSTSAPWSLQAPANLTAQVSRDFATFSWQHQRAGLKYNLRIGTAPGSEDILFSASRPDGQRLLPLPGNAQTSKTWHIGKLQPGTYYWSVQAVDSGFRGSPFSEEHSFTIQEPGELPAPPTISPLGHIYTEEDVATEPLPFTVGPADGISELEVTVQSDNPSLTPATSFLIEGTTSERALTIFPAQNVSGQAIITIRVADPFGQSATESFVLSVAPVNDPPQIEEIPNQQIYLGQDKVVIPLVYSDVETPQRFLLSVSAASSDSLFLSPGRLEISNSSLIISPSTVLTGAATVTVTVNDGSLQSSTSFVLLVQPPAFQPGAILDGSPGYPTEWVDFNNDGRLDLIIGRDAKVLRGNMSTFTEELFNFAPGPALSVIPADFDNDNDLDLLYTSYGRVAFIRNNATNFAEAALGLPQGGDFFVGPAGDIDNDGDIDFFLRGTLSSGGLYRRLYLNVNDGTRFQAALWPEGALGNVQLADIDRDGWLDLISFGDQTGLNDGRDGLYRGVGGGGFEYQPLPEISDRIEKYGLVDLDNDGWLDLWGLDSGQIILYRGLGRHFELIDALPPFTSRAHSFDYDQDGRLDFLTWSIAEDEWGRPAGHPFLYLNRTAFQFKPAGNPLNGFTTVNVAFGDYDNNGAMDLLASEQLSPLSSRLRLASNLSRVRNAPPAPPANLKATLTNGWAVFTWSPATDLNQSSGLTYNVRVGTAPGASDVLSAMARPDGKRLVVAPGNAGHRTNLFLTNLLKPIYYWSVQAVDHSYAGSVFAPEQKLFAHMAGDEPPVITVPGSFVGPEDKESSFTLTLSDDRFEPELLSLRIIPNDPLLVPLSRINIEGVSTSRTVRFLPVTNGFGTASFTLEAGGPVGPRSTKSVQIVITNVNDSPTISSLPTFFASSPLESLTVPFTIGDVDHAHDQLDLTAVSDNPALLPAENVVFSGAGSNRSATFQGTSAASGKVNLSFTVTDPEGLSSTSSFLVHFTNRIFTLANTNFFPVRDGSIAWGDFDSDGDLDVAVTGQGTPQTMIYVNLGGDQFEPLDIAIPMVDGGGVEWGDYDNDSDLDLLLHGRGPESFIAHLYRNDRSGNLTQVPLAVTGRYGPAAFGDYDDDGDLDILSTGQDWNELGTTSTELYRNDNGIFVSALLLPSRVRGRRLFEDFNGDGTLDLHLQFLGQYALEDTLYTNSGTGFLQVSPPWSGWLFAWGDLNQDGLPDAVTSQSQILRIEQNSGAAFSSIQQLWTNKWMDSVSLGDYDNDGLLDLFASGGFDPYETAIFHNEGTNGFREVLTPLADRMFSTTAWADYDNDGDLDLLITGQRLDPQSGYYTELYRNDLPKPNTPPASPSGLRASYSGEELRIEWDPATDQNQAGGFTYNVALGTVRGYWDVLFPMSRSDGWRLLPKPGNAGWLTWKNIRALEVGQTYFFTVQAIDNSFAGSEFVPESSITIGNGWAVAFPATIIVPENQTFTGEISITGAVDPEAAYLITATSSNQDLLPDSAIQFEGRQVILSPVRGMHGAARVTLSVENEQGEAITQSFTLSVTKNLAPSILAAHFNVFEDQPFSFQLTASDPENGLLTFRVYAPPRRGNLLIEGAGFTYWPHTNQFGSDSARIEIEDDAGHTARADLVFEIHPVPDNLQPRLELAQVQSSFLKIHFSAEPHQYYSLQASENLREWTSLLSSISSTGEILFSIPAPQGQMMFFRAVPQ